MTERQPKPDWLKIDIGARDRYAEVKRVVAAHGLNTICAAGRCPNIGDCWRRGTATFMIGGDTCTRACKFCNTPTGKPAPLRPEEPLEVARSIALMGLTRAVVTSVDRDDVPDLGASHWVETILQVKRLNPALHLETLIPDFQGRRALIARIIEARPHCISHNMETVRRLSPVVRSAARYERSLELLHQVAASGITCKSGIMVGLGETKAEVEELMDHLRAAGCEVLTIGQYLQPTRHHYPVAEYVHPSQFALYKRIGLEKGFTSVESGPLVRSSYKA